MNNSGVEVIGWIRIACIVWMFIVSFKFHIIIVIIALKFKNESAEELEGQRLFLWYEIHIECQIFLANKSRKQNIVYIQHLVQDKNIPLLIVFVFEDIFYLQRIQIKNGRLLPPTLHTQ